jgi:anti-anti-sigma factor
VASDSRIPPQVPPFEVRVHERSGVAMVHVRGEVDLATAPQLRGRTREELEAGRQVVLDLEEVTFIDCRGVMGLIELSREAAAAGASLSLARASRAVRRMVGLMEVEGELALASDEVDKA